MQQLVDRPPLLAAVSEGLREAPVVALLGARQVGKTTLARQLAAAWPGSTRVFDLEVAATREALAQTPEAILRGSNGLVVVDEVQRMPALFEVLRPICDDPSRKAFFSPVGQRFVGFDQGRFGNARGQDAVRRCGWPFACGGGWRSSKSAVDARRFPARVAGFVIRGVEAMDGVVHADVPGARYPRAGIARAADRNRAILAHARPLPPGDEPS